MEKDLLEIIKDVLREEEFSREGLAFLGDDCAVTQMATGASYLFSVDHLSAGIHYDPRYYSPFDIGWKAAAVNISDIAAMAGEAVYLLVGLSLGTDVVDKKKWVQEFYRGLNALSKTSGQAIVIGGDLCSALSTTISVTVIGKSKKTPISRKGAKAGQKIYVTGKFGNALSFRQRIEKLDLNNSAEIKNFLDDEWQKQSSDIRYALRAKPRIKEAKQIIHSKLNVTALIDTSDGLAAALLEIAAQSSVKLCFQPESIPRDPHISLEQALFGGEDYELVACADSDIPGWTEIGGVLSGEGQVVDNQGLSLDSSALYSHF